MAVRIRKIDGYTIAFCAAATPAKDGDLYLDDTIDHALRVKYKRDYVGEGLMSGPLLSAHDLSMIRQVERALHERTMMEERDSG